ncbi:hypothetical protein B0H14DRAFT_3440342 [Mycena olivaceomarginata]|nr:hypothetical protein B0H14DRAFT_3440342 [Mycena olivaceomarginata]
MAPTRPDFAVAATEPAPTTNRNRLADCTREHYAGANSEAVELDLEHLFIQFACAATSISVGVVAVILVVGG